MSFSIPFPLQVAALRLLFMPNCFRFGSTFATRIPFGWLLNKKAAGVEVNIFLTFLYWVGIAVQSPLLTFRL